ncbi:hypothetical protein D3C76_602010 [compost metagenome]
MFLRQELGEQRPCYRVFEAHPHTYQEAQHEQRNARLHPEGTQRADNEQDGPNEEQAPTADLVGQPATQEAAAEGPQHGRGGNQALPERIQFQVVGKLHDHHPDDTQDVTVQDPAPACAQGH